MVGRGCRFESGSQLHVFIFGLILAYNTMFSSYTQASLGSCKSINMTLMYQQCVSHKDGVHGLDCFGKYKASKKTCVWRPGNYTSEKTYTLIIRQQSKKYCYININRFSEDITINEKRNMTAEVFEVSKSTNCTMAVFSGSPQSMVRCDPPYGTSFSRNSGGLDVNVSWKKEDLKIITGYAVRYKAQGSPSWNESLQQCQKGKQCTVTNLNSSLVYTVQIQCVSNYCSQCLWSKVYTVPSELTTHPVIVNLQDTDIAGEKGRRLLILTWMFPARELYDGYNVTISKASGEKSEFLNTIQPEIRLILSYSAFNVDICAFNNASTSPSVSQIIPQRQDEASLGAGRLDVEVHSNMSFTIKWKDNLIQQYVCYSAEWMTKGHKVAYKPFYQNEKNYRELSSLPEPLEPYKRYSITLHTRPDKVTCNMKHVNNSESTYGSTQFYFIEGSPVSAPANISSFNMTLHSMVLQWSSIPEEDLRGFLLGYIIYYSEFGQTGTSTEKNITVSPEFNSCKLKDLKSGTAYEVQVSGFTLAGEGVRSTSSLFKTNSQGYSKLSVVIKALAVVATVVIFGPLIFKRAKVVLWPSIPHPGNSNAVQKIEGPCELELLESINTLEVEEWDTNSLQILEKEDVKPASTLPSLTPLLHGSEDEEDEAEMTCIWEQRDTEDATGDTVPDRTAETFPDAQRTNIQASSLAFVSGYTTMEMFQQVNSQVVPQNTSVTREIKPVETDSTEGKSSFDYVRQFSNSPVNSPVFDSTEMSMSPFMKTFWSSPEEHEESDNWITGS